MQRSLLEWLYPSQPLSFEAPGPVSEAVRRLRSAVKRTALQTPFREALVGSVSPSRVVLRRHRPWIGNDLGPTFVGRFVQRPDSVRLEGALTLHPFARRFVSLSVAFLALFLAVAVVRIAVALSPTVAGDPRMGDELFFLAVVLGGALYGIGLLRLSRWFSRKDGPYIATRIATALGGSVVGRGASGGSGPG